MEHCVMCKALFLKEALDFLGRCEPCFRIYMAAPEALRPSLGVPFVPTYNGKAKYGF